MRKPIIILLTVALLVILCFWFWPRSQDSGQSATAYSTTVELSGTPGAAFSGEYVRDGKRVPISDSLPWSLTESNISRLEIRKTKAEDTLVVDARGGVSRLSVPISAGTLGARVKMEGGWSFEIIR